MKTKFKRIGVLTSGGDAPGMNPCIRAITRRALAHGVDVMGIKGGYRGLVENDMTPLTPRSVSYIITRGGTFLYSERCPEFATEQGMKKALETCRSHNIDAVVAIGGDGTFRGAEDLSRHGIPTIAIPGTIDNDITASEYTIGYDTAMNTVMMIADDLRDTCESHNRCNVVEVMGRRCGLIALVTGIAVGAVAIAIPEISFDEKAAFEKIRSVRATGKRGMLVLVSEGMEQVNGTPYSEILTDKIKTETGVDTRFARLAHIVRGGSPTLRDRLTATEMGALAVDLLLQGKSNMAICQIDDIIRPVDLKFVITVDKMYKSKLKDGDLDEFSDRELQKMRDICAKKHDYISTLYELSHSICK